MRIDIKWLMTALLIVTVSSVATMQFASAAGKWSGGKLQQPVNTGLELDIQPPTSKKPRTIPSRLPIRGLLLSSLLMLSTTTPAYARVNVASAHQDTLLIRRVFRGELPPAINPTLQRQRARTLARMARSGEFANASYAPGRFLGRYRAFCRGFDIRRTTFTNAVLSEARRDGFFENGIIPPGFFEQLRGQLRVTCIGSD